MTTGWRSPATRMGMRTRPRAKVGLLQHPMSSLLCFCYVHIVSTHTRLACHTHTHTHNWHISIMRLSRHPGHAQMHTRAHSDGALLGPLSWGHASTPLLRPLASMHPHFRMCAHVHTHSHTSMGPVFLCPATHKLIHPAPTAFHMRAATHL